MGELRAFFAGGDSPPLVESLFDVRVGNRASIVERRLRRVSHTCDTLDKRVWRWNAVVSRSQLLKY